MRGIAAFAVVLFHIGATGPIAPVPGGYLAVDFFFVLSGLVVSRAYASRLQAGLSVTGFMQIRIARLYPLYLFGFLIGLAELLMRVDATPALWATAILNLLMLPGLPARSSIIEVNLPGWSLALEIFVNLLYAMLLPRLSSIRLAAAVAASGGVLAVGIALHGSANIGAFWSDAAFGLPRILWSFGVGVLIGRSGRQVTRQHNGLALAALAALALALIVPVQRHFGWMGDALVVLVGFPALVYWCAGFDCEPTLARLFSKLGAISYPVFILHFPLLLAALAIMHRFAVPPQLAGAAGIIAVIAVAIAAGRFIEKPARRWMMARLNP